MASPIQPCSCVPYSNICCCGPQNGITVVQPTCQNLPDGSVVNNPAFAPELNLSYWTYKFYTDCAMATRGISNFVIPICSVLQTAHVNVEEKIDGCGQFSQVPFSLSPTDPNFGPAPSGFQWLKVETNGRYEKGVWVEYRITLTGNFVNATSSIKVKAANTIYTFDCGCFIVPACNPAGRLALIKECSYDIVNNQATLNYTVEVNNIGNAPLTNVQYTDTIIIPADFTIGTITVTPNTLTVTVSPAGQVTISGNLGTIAPGGQILITYQIPITSITIPGDYLITNTAFASAEGTESTDSCVLHLRVVQLKTSKCCIVAEDGSLAFRVHIASVGNSPDINVDLLDTIMIPAGVTVQFHDFAGCTAVFESTTEPVPINTDITGPVAINIMCSGIPINSGSISEKVFRMTIVSSSVAGSTVIANSIESVTQTNPDQQIFLGAGMIPVSAIVHVTLSFVCNNPCI